MQLSLFTDYALRTLMYLGTAPDRRVTLREVADAYDISLEHLRKVVARLANVGLIDSRQGRGGGLRLGRAAAAISIGEVVRLMEGTEEVVDCEGRDCLLLPGCMLRSELRSALGAFYAHLDGRTLADLIEPRSLRRRLIALRPVA